MEELTKKHILVIDDDIYIGNMLEEVLSKVCRLQRSSSGEYTLYGSKNAQREIVKPRRRMGAVIETPAIYSDMTAGLYLTAQPKYKK